MSFLNFLIALSPIIVVLVGILAFHQSAKKVAPIALIWTLILAFTYFNVTGATFAENVKTYDALLWKGIKEGLKIVLMVFGAFVILNILRETGAIEEVKNTIARISDDRRVQVVIIGMMLPIFLEGAAGAGAPAAIAAPFLVALGFDPVTSIALALLGDATPCSWGGAGLTTINGGATLVDAGISTVALNSAMVGRIHMFGVLIIPFLMIAMTFGKKGFTRPAALPLLRGHHDQRDHVRPVELRRRGGHVHGHGHHLHPPLRRSMSSSSASRPRRNITTSTSPPSTSSVRSAPCRPTSTCSSSCRSCGTASPRSSKTALPSCAPSAISSG